MKKNAPTPLNQQQWINVSLLIALVVIGVRIISLFMLPLMDTTEARYGEMARMMAESGDWITPMFDYGVPFWGKPPMFTWLSAAGIKLMGVNEFAVRIPHLAVAMLALLPIGYLVYCETGDKARAFLAAGVATTTGIFIIVGGSVMTDSALNLAITLAMVSFWKLAHAEPKTKTARLWAAAFAVALSLGMLSKGPIAIVLIGLGLFGWFVVNNTWALLLRLPWLLMLGVFALLTAPWYIMAEMKTPGFLEYFIIGEHVMRFLVSDWSGDLYGDAHEQVRGMIWLLWLVVALPWSPLLIWQAVKSIRKSDTQLHWGKSLTSYLWFWLLAPLFMFTLSGNILSSYVNPAVAPMAILIALRLDLASRACFKLVRSAGLTLAAILTLATLVLGLGLTDFEPEKNLLADWQVQVNHKQVPLYYVGSRPHSAQFYSAGYAKQIDTTDELIRPSYLVYKKKYQSRYDLTGCERVSESKARILSYCQ
jgi:4-amino-4-deoxy-L-arabinose transferase-like glycosyltransferase